MHAVLSDEELFVILKTFRTQAGQQGPTLQQRTVTIELKLNARKQSGYHGRGIQPESLINPKDAEGMVVVKHQLVVCRVAVSSSIGYYKQ